MKISEDQNTVEYDGVKGKFIETTVGVFMGCSKCMFIGEVSCCKASPCEPWQRKDMKNGYFKEVED